jgi:hypothetical protein
MSIPTNITTELASLQAQVAAAAPLANASHATIVVLQLNAENLVNDIQTALTAPNNPLDTFVAPVDPQAIIAGVENLSTVAQDQYTLSLMRGVVGRAAANLEQL